MNAPAHPILRRRLWVALVCLLVTFPATARPHGRSERGVTLFVDVGYEGPSETFFAAVPDLRWSALGNDRASSIAVSPGCVVTLFEDSWYHGRTTVLDHDHPDLRQLAIGNDRVSSLAVDCRERASAGPLHRDSPVVLCEDDGFGGRCEAFAWDDPDLRDNFLGNDRASAVAVAPGCVAVLYEDSGYRGRRTIVHHDLPFLAGSEVGNDRVSSLEVDCRGHRGGRYGRGD